MLHYFAGENHVKKLRHELLIDASAINDRDGNGWTPLHYAAAGGAACMVALQVLLEHKADFNRKNRKGDTPLHVAAAARHMESASELIKAGCDFEARNNDGHTPFELLDDKSRDAWERDRWIRAALEQGRELREQISRQVQAEREAKAELAKLAEAKRKEEEAAAAAQAEIDAAVAGGLKKAGRAGEGRPATAAAVQGKRAKYMALRDKLAVKMKREKTESRRVVADLSVQLKEVRLEQAQQRALEDDDKASWRAIPGADAALAEEDARHEILVLRRAEALEDEIEARKGLIVCEAAAEQLKLRAWEAEADMAGASGLIDAALHRVHQLSRLVPVARLLGAAVRMDRRRVVVAEERERVRLEKLH